MCWCPLDLPDVWSYARRRLTHLRAHPCLGTLGATPRLYKDPTYNGYPGATCGRRALRCRRRRRSVPRATGGSRLGASREDVGLPDDDQVMRTLLRIRIQPLAVVAAHALGHDDLGPLDRPPLARLLADAAGLALRPSLDAEDGDLRQDSEERAERTEEAAVE